MAAPEDSYEGFVREVLRPTNVETLKEPYDRILINVYEDPESEEPTNEIELRNLYPFNTVYDLMTMIYMESGQQDEYHPENQCLMQTSNGKIFIHFQYILTRNNLELEYPFAFMASGRPKTQFVDPAGNAKPIQITSRFGMLLENTLFTRQRDEHVLHLFLYRDIYRAFQGVKPMNPGSWDGMIHVLFPNRERGQEDGSLTPEAEGFRETLVQRFTCKQLLTDTLEEQLEGGVPLRKPGESDRGEQVSLSNIKNLRFAWKKPKPDPSYEAFELEGTFYDTPVSREVPYIRFYPKSGSPLSKLYVEGPLNQPAMERPEILLKWAEMTTQTPQEDLVMIKILIRPASGSVDPLYATMYIHQDGSAKFIIQPNQGEKSLSRQADLTDLAGVLERITESLPKLLSKKVGVSSKKVLNAADIRLEDAYVVLSLWLEKSDTTPITRKSLANVLPLYRPFFQITASPLQFQSPLAYLRFKCVNDFQTPSRDSQFLQRVLTLQKLDGSTNLAILVKHYMEHYDVPEAVAITRVRTFISDATRFDPVNPLELEYTQAVSPGFDVAIFGKHPSYTFHIYGANSIKDLKRIKTLLSLLVSVEPISLERVKRCYTPLAEQEAEEQRDADANALADARGALEEEEVPASVVSAVAAAAVVADTVGDEEGAAMFDELGGFSGFGDEEEDGAAPLLEELARRDTPEASSAAPPPQKGVTGPEINRDEDDEEDITDATQLKKIKSKTYFGLRLDFFDRKLFKYHKGIKGIQKYSSMCAANALKQPAVMNEDEYQRMKDEYEPDIEAGNVLFLEYPIKKGQAIPEPKSEDTEVITALRYGSNLLPGRANYYMCSQFWCRQDEIIVLKSDYYSTTDRKGRPKDKETCPFCRGGPVKNRTLVLKGESVIERITKSKSTEEKRHLWVRFLGKNPHPLGLYLPCCFLKDKPIFEDKEPAFAEWYTSQKARPGILPPPSEAARTRELPPQAGLIPVNYAKKIQDVKHWYILGAEKFPLEVLRDGPQIGILPGAVERYFGQNALEDLVVNDHTVWKLKKKGDEPNVSGFFRIAVENSIRSRPESFMAAIAPYFQENSALGIKRRILGQLQPPVFMALNYGNFLFDFFNPADTTPPSAIEISRFVKMRLATDTGVGEVRQAVERALKSFNAFEIYMNDTNHRKEYRQFAQFLSLPNLLYWEDKQAEEGERLRSNGVLFIVLEVKKSGEVEVRCPPYGVNREMASRCDVAFILHYEDGVWEPVLYTENSAEEGISSSYFTFSRQQEEGWPAIVKKRVQEFENMCYSSGLGIYTDSWSISSQTLIPLSEGMRIPGTATSILRDAYNHVSGIVFKISTGSIIVPVIDDGSIYPTLKIEMSWRNLARQLAPVGEVLDFYKTKVSTVLGRQSPQIRASYTFDTTLFRLDASVPAYADVHALRLANGLIVPVRKIDREGEVELESKIFEEGQLPPWEIDHKIVFGSKEADLKLEINYQEFEEIYQHFRFTFANWLSRQPKPLSESIKTILFKEGKPNRDLPLFEKRKRLFILLGAELNSWLDSGIPVRDQKPSLKRVDCIAISDSKECSNRCVWKEGEGGGCLLHIPERFEIGVKEVDVKQLFIRKLIEELIRFPLKRGELIHKRVRKYITLYKPFRSDTSLIIPEKSIAWIELLRMEWAQAESDTPKYLEEYSAIQPRIDGAQAAPAPVPAPAALGEEAVAADIPVSRALPELVRTYLGTSKTKDTGSFYTTSSGSVLPLLTTFGLTQAELAEAGQPLEAPMIIPTPEILDFLARRLEMSIVTVFYEEDTPLEPSVKIVSVLSGKTPAPVLLFFSLDDGSAGIVSDSKDELIPIPISRLSVTLNVKIRRAEKSITL
jgi:hypothetical protein